MRDNDRMTVGPEDDRPVDLLSEDEGLEVLPDQTRDDTDDGWGEIPEPDDDARLIEEVPPHWS
ncbi:MAG: hypothetical protein JWN00_3602 [Actinomycetia bacterium]|jgi:hypothetical protein|nr:hypothetical protein [Actinomycetes bacterium]